MHLPKTTIPREFYWLLGLLLLLLAGATLRWWLKRSENKSLTGHAFVFESELYRYDSEREWLLGDGYSMQVDSLDEATAAWFLAPDSLFFQSPDWGSGGLGWERVSWHATPVQPAEDEILWFALKDEAEPYLDFITKALHQSGSYCAYRYLRLDTTIVSDIKFYLLSPRDKKLIWIVSNT